MSQTTAPDDDSTEQIDPGNVADTVTAVLEVAVDTLSAVSESDVADMSDEELVEVRQMAKDLEDDVSEFRKDVADSEVEARVDPGESLLGLSVIESHNKYVAEDDGAVVARAVSQGIDYTEFVSVNASTLAKEHPDLAEIGEAPYTYVR